ncbi:MAG: hypothetical protein IPK56_05165 [Elusimicrobia bacterium]|nr:hypothetical protein [Elusimicrobiota bacterium]MBK9056691.1 hypothetical protein [Elusimicrobiota bacterium]
MKMLSRERAMVSRKQFSERIAQIRLSHSDRAIALLWYYRETQAFDERSPSELAADLHDLDFPKPNITRLVADLKKSRYTISGKRKGTFQLDARKIEDLNGKYLKLLDVPDVQVKGEFLPPEWTNGTRKYLEQIVRQINGCYEAGFYDGCATLCRRLMESLVIDVYVSAGRSSQIQKDGKFFSLEPLLSTIIADKTVLLGRNTPETMRDVKTMGDTAAHDRTYVTPKLDLDDIRLRYRHMIQELLGKAGIKPVA